MSQDITDVQEQSHRVNMSGCHHRPKVCGILRMVFHLVLFRFVAHELGLDSFSTGVQMIILFISLSTFEAGSGLPCGKTLCSGSELSCEHPVCALLFCIMPCIMTQDQIGKPFYCGLILQSLVFETGFK